MAPNRLNDPVAHLLWRLETSAPRQIIGLAGLPGSGKSTFAARLAAQVNAATAPATMMALGMDGFHFSKAQLRQFPDPAAALARRGAPWTFDVGAMLERLRALREAERNITPWPGFEHETGDPVEAASLINPATRLILVEGLYLLHGDASLAPIRQIFEERWFLDVPWEIARERLIARHQKSWNWSRAQAENRIAENDAHNAELVWAERGAADYFVGRIPHKNGPPS